MHIKGVWISHNVFVMRLYALLAKIWFIPFGFYYNPIMTTKTIPHPLKPRCFRDFILNKMMFPDTIDRAIVSDKIAARGWAAGLVGKKFLVPLYDIIDTPAEMAARHYPYPYVVKTNHASGLVAFVKDDTSRAQMLKDIKTWNAGAHNPDTEWAYHDIKRKFMVEKMLIGTSPREMQEIKIFCFFGKPVLVRSISHPVTGTIKAFLTPEWVGLDMQYYNYYPRISPDKPAELPELLRLAGILSTPFDFARVDLMLCDGNIYFGELTSFTAAGHAMFIPHSFDTDLYEKYLVMRQQKISDTRDGFHKQELANLNRCKTSDLGG